MAPAVERILGAIARRERIAIHGDYDVDGVTSTVILRRALELLGADVIHFIPERLRDGYGLQPAALDRLHADGVRLVISVDCGIRAADAARHATALGLDLIITDHHEPDDDAAAGARGDQPEAPRLQLSRQEPRRRRRGAEAGAGAVPARPAERGWLPAFVKIAAIGTLADVVPLTGENRIIAKLGLGMLSTGPHKVGLRSLLDVCGLTGKEIDSYHIGFVLGAAGQRRRPHEHAGHRRAPAAGVRRGDGRRGARAGRAARTPRTSAASRRRPRSSRRRRRRRDRPRGRLAHGHRRRRRGLAPRRHRHRRVEARGRVSPAGDRAVDGRRRRARIVPQHPVVQHAGGARIVRGADDEVRRPQAGGRPDDRVGAHPRAARARQRVRRRMPAARRPAAAPLDRRRADVPLDQRAGRVRADRAGAVRRRQPQPGLPRQRRGDRRRPAAAEGAPPEDGVQAGRPRHARHRLARRRSARRSSPSTAAPSTSRSRSSRTPGTASAICSCPSPISARPIRTNGSAASAAAPRGRARRTGCPASPGSRSGCSRRRRAGLPACRPP